MSKTNIWIEVSFENFSPDREFILKKYRVKLDSQKFPYIIHLNEKVILRTKQMEYDDKWIWGEYDVHVKFIEGYEEFLTILNNSDLTIDKLSLKQLVRLG
jgi:hypothetical protein